MKFNSAAVNYYTEYSRSCLQISVTRKKGPSSFTFPSDKSEQKLTAKSVTILLLFVQAILPSNQFPTF